MRPMMADRLTPAQRSYNMSRIRSKGSRVEMLVRRLVHSLGYRYRLHRKELPGSPDLVFPRFHKVIFVHGCFWHRHHCSSGQLVPSTNKTYWLKKFAVNKRRDSQSREALQEDGWGVLVLWECETRDLDKLTEQITSFLGGNPQSLRTSFAS